MNNTVKQDNCDIIITYCWNRVGYNILKSLSLRGLAVWCADTSRKNICSMSRFCTGSFTYPDPFTDEKAFIDCLKQKIKELNPLMLLPTHDESVIIMRHKDEFPDNLLIPYENPDLLLKLSNKSIATRIAKECNVPIPQVYSTINDIGQYPIVFKTVIGNSAKTVFFPTSKTELLKLSELYKTKEVLMEEYIGGSDYSVDCVRWNGFWKSSVYHAILTKTNGGGTTTQRELIHFPELEVYARRMLDYVDFHGVCGIDFRVEQKSGRVAFIEINARFTGGLATPIAAGFDIPWILYELATKNQYNDPIIIKDGIKTKWILGDVITLVDRLLSLNLKWSELKQIMNFRGFECFDDYDKNDKFAILGEMHYYFEKLIRNRKLNS